jgi:hypothetical protein
VVYVARVEKVKILRIRVKLSAGWILTVDIDIEILGLEDLVVVGNTHRDVHGNDGGCERALYKYRI